MAILIDYREIEENKKAGGKDITTFEPLASMPLNVTHLDSADVAFTGNGPNGKLFIGIEIKKIGELISAYDAGRLQGTQIPAMINTYDVPIVARYGEYRFSQQTGLLQVLITDKSDRVVWRNGKPLWVDFKLGSRTFQYSYVASVIMSISAKGIRCERVSSKSELAMWIACIYKWWQEPWKSHKSMNSFDTTQDLAIGGLDFALRTPEAEARLQRAKTAASLPGIREGRGYNAADHFESIHAMINADELEWAKIPKIGKVIARDVVRAIRHKSSEVVSQQAVIIRTKRRKSSKSSDKPTVGEIVDEMDFLNSI